MTDELKQIESAQRVQSKVRSAYRRVFNSPEGHVVLLHLCREAYVFSPAFVQGDPYQSALNEGSRRVVLSIIRKAFKSESDLLGIIETNYQTEQNNG